VDARFGSIEGVTRTRVGYTGGTKKDPTYRNLRDHTEAVQIEFDPKQVPYRKLVDLFWSSHDPHDRSGSRQYMAAAFYHTEEQKRVILEAQARSSSGTTGKIFTQVLPASIFYPAEEYHQKYFLQGNRTLMKVLEEHYPDRTDLLESTVAARLNGYLAGHMSFGEMREALERLVDLPQMVREKILESMPGRAR
jgi:peptide-methionine (S)-S-oxide reductase